MILWILEKISNFNFLRGIHEILPINKAKQVTESMLRISDTNILLIGLISCRKKLSIFALYWNLQQIIAILFRFHSYWVLIKLSRTSFSFSFFFRKHKLRKAQKVHVSSNSISPFSFLSCKEWQLLNPKRCYC